MRRMPAAEISTIVSADKIERKYMYVSRLTFLTLPGKTGELESELKTLLEIVKGSGGENTRILRTHFASPRRAKRNI